MRPWNEESVEFNCSTTTRPIHQSNIEYCATATSTDCRKHLSSDNNCHARGWNNRDADNQCDLQPRCWTRTLNTSLVNPHIFPQRKKNLLEVFERESTETRPHRNYRLNPTPTTHLKSTGSFLARKLVRTIRFHSKSDLSLVK